MSVYNGERFLAEAVASILDQTFADFELIVVDDASTDASVQILQSFRDERIRLISLPKNVGLVEALNLAMGRACGSLLARMDADDIAASNRFELQVQLLDQHPQVVLVGSAFALIDESGKAFGTRVVLCDNEALQAGLMSGNQICHPSVMMRAEAVRRIGGYRNLAGRYAQDYDLWLRLAECGALMNLPEVLLQYRVHDGQVSIAKGMAQRRAAEFYRRLALQRRQSGVEDPAAIWSMLDADQAALRATCAQDMMEWAADFDKQGRHAAAKSLRWRAVRFAPLSPAVRRMLSERLQWRMAAWGIRRK